MDSAGSCHWLPKRRPFGERSFIRSPSASGGCKLRSPLGMPGEPYAIHRFERECVAALGPGHITGDGLLAELGSVLDACAAPLKSSGRSVACQIECGESFLIYSGSTAVGNFGKCFRMRSHCSSVSRNLERGDAFGFHRRSAIPRTQ